MPLLRACAARSRANAISDDFEIAGELPIGDGLTELAFFPFAGGCVMLDESIPEQSARRRRLLEPLRRLPQGARQCARRRKALRIGISADRRIRLDSVLDTPQPRADRGGEREIWVDIGGGDPVLDPLRLG